MPTAITPEQYNSFDTAIKNTNNLISGVNQQQKSNLPAISNVLTPPTPPPPQTPPGANTENIPTPISDQQKIVNTGQEKLASLQDDYQRKAQDVQNTITNIQNGTVPLSPGEQAQVQGLQQQFQQLIQQQQQVNESAKGTANIRGYQTGAAEYDPNFQAKTIGTIVTAGLNKVAELNTKMASAVASLTQSLKDNDIRNVKDSFEIYQTAYKERQSALQKTVDETQKVIETARKEQYDRVTKPIEDIAKDAAKNGATPDVIKAISNAGSVQEALNAAGDTLQTASGIIGEYQFYKKQALAAGQVPVDFNTYQNIDANRKISIAKAGVAGASGLNPSTLTKVENIAGQFDNEQSVKNYQVVAEGKSFLDSISNSTKNPADQQGVIYAFAKIMDPNSVVREGEYNTVQKYAQSWAQTYGFNAARIFSNSPFLTEQAIKNMKATIDSKVKASEKSYNNIADEYGRRINKITGMQDGKDYITDYSKGYTKNQDLLQQGEQAEQTLTSNLNSIKTSNPKLFSTASKMYISTNPQTGLPYSAEDILQAFPELSK